MFLLGPLPKTKADNHFILVMAGCFTKLPQVLLLKLVTGLDASKAFASKWVFKYGTRKESLFDKPTVGWKAVTKHVLHPLHRKHIHLGVSAEENLKL